MLWSDLDADLDPPQWELRHMRPPNQWPSWTRSSMRVCTRTLVDSRLLPLILLWHPLSLHLSTPPPLFHPPSLHPSHPPLTEDDVTFCQLLEDHATVTVGCSVYTEIESNKSHERERRERRRGRRGKKEEKNQDESRRRNVLSGVRGWMGLPKQVLITFTSGRDVAGAHIHVDALYMGFLKLCTC